MRRRRSPSGSSRTCSPGTFGLKKTSSINSSTRAKSDLHVKAAVPFGVALRGIRAFEICSSGRRPWSASCRSSRRGAPGKLSQRVTRRLVLVDVCQQQECAGERLFAAVEQLVYEIGLDLRILLVRRPALSAETGSGLWFVNDRITRTRAARSAPPGTDPETASTHRGRHWPAGGMSRNVSRFTAVSCDMVAVDPCHED